MALVVNSAVFARVKDKFLIIGSFVRTPNQGRRDHLNDAHQEGLHLLVNFLVNSINSKEWTDVEFPRHCEGQ